MFARRDYRLIKSLSIETKQKREPPKKGIISVVSETGMRAIPNR